MKELKKKIAQVRKMKKVHYDATKPMDAYFAGLYNGIEYALSILTDKEPKYKAVKVRRYRALGA